MINLEPNEVVVTKVRKHWIVLVGQILLLAVIFIMPFLLYWLGTSFDFVHIQGNQSALLTALGGMWLLLLWINFFVFWTGGYFFDVWVITDHRVLYVNQKGLFHREVSTMRLDKIQDIDVEVTGILQSLLGLGTIRIQSAGEIEEFVFNGVADPDGVKETINRLANKQIEESRTVRIAQDSAPPARN